MRRETIWTPSDHMDEDLESHNLRLTKAVGMAHNHLLWRLLAANALIAVQARNYDDAVRCDVILISLCVIQHWMKQRQLIVCGWMYGQNETRC